MKDINKQFKEAHKRFPKETMVLGFPFLPVPRSAYVDWDGYKDTIQEEFYSSGRFAIRPNGDMYDIYSPERKIYDSESDTWAEVVAIPKNLSELKRESDFWKAFCFLFFIAIVIIQVQQSLT